MKRGISLHLKCVIRPDWLFEEHGTHSVFRIVVGYRRFGGLCCLHLQGNGWCTFVFLYSLASTLITSPRSLCMCRYSSLHPVCERFQSQLMRLRSFCPT